MAVIASVLLSQSIRAVLDLSLTSVALSHGLSFFDHSKMADFSASSDLLQIDVVSCVLVVMYL